MRFVYFAFAVINYIIFALDITYDRDFTTWMLLGTSIFFAINAYVAYNKYIADKRKKESLVMMEDLIEEASEDDLVGHCDHLWLDTDIIAELPEREFTCILCEKDRMIGKREWKLLQHNHKIVKNREGQLYL